MEPDVTGYPIDAAISILINHSYKYRITETASHRKTTYDRCRVVRQRYNNTDNVFELTVSYF